MKSAELINGEIKITDVEKPYLKNNEKGAIIKVLGCGLCGSDLVKIKHAREIKDENYEKKVILGHEVVGIVEEINLSSYDYQSSLKETLKFEKDKLGSIKLMIKF